MAVHIPRQAQTLLETLLARNPAVLIVGARQIGKSSPDCCCCRNRQ
ncbi:MAG: hypothetical protein OXC81_05830 [Betaproteobacteria bacterium]|nr:hypothetical protein [Betaproteobacteria bacterium]